MRLILFALTLLVSLNARSETVAVPTLQQRVTDTTHTLSAQARSSLTQTLAQFEKDIGHQLAVLLVDTTGGETIGQYSTRVFDSWKLGDKKRDDGLLLILAKADHTLRIEVGYGLEGVVTDLQASQVINRSIVPYLKHGDFERGIQAGVDKRFQISTNPASAAEAHPASYNDSMDLSGIGIFGRQLGMPFLPLVIISFLRGHGFGGGGGGSPRGGGFGGSGGSLAAVAVSVVAVELPGAGKRASNRNGFRL